MRRAVLLLAAATLGLSACGPDPSAAVADRAAAEVILLPPMRTFPPQKVSPTVRSNRQLAQDFLDLSFTLESGRPVPRLTRFDGEITLGVRGPASAILQKDLARLIARLRREAGLDIRLAKADETPNILVEVIPRRELQRAVPEAACFVVPRVSGWDEFRAERRSDKTDWTTLTERTTASVFLPSDVSPQEARDCLHEEIAQALGPLNDLYRLPDSVFNDDNFHTVLTGFDMLMLKVTYDPALQNGMSRDEVAARLPAILARLNPAGEHRRDDPVPPTTHAWREAIERALGPRGSDRSRRAAAARAVDIARSEGWTDSRLGFSYYALGRLSLADAPDVALVAFIESARVYRRLPDTGIQAAHVAMQLSAFALSAGQMDGTLALVNDSLPAVREAENAALLSTFLMMQAAVYDQTGRGAAAEALRTEALGWARYGFGSDALVRERALEVAALAEPRAGG